VVAAGLGVDAEVVGMMGSNHPTMGDVAFDAAQSLRAKVEALEKRVAELEATVKRLEALLPPPAGRL
jgi:hypothetical protein